MPSTTDGGSAATTNTDTDTPRPGLPTLVQIRSTVAANLDAARQRLVTARARRDEADALVRTTLAEVEELERVNRQLNAKPRTSKAKKT